MSNLRWGHNRVARVLHVFRSNYLLFYNFLLISDYEINYTKLFYSNFWAVSPHLFSMKKTLLYTPDSTNFLVELTVKQLTRQRASCKPLKRLETWCGTNAPLWLLIGRIIFLTHENTIIHNYSDWTIFFFHVCKTLLAP